MSERASAQPLTARSPHDTFEVEAEMDNPLRDPGTFGVSSGRDVEEGGGTDRSEATTRNEWSIDQEHILFGFSQKGRSTSGRYQGRAGYADIPDFNFDRFKEGDHMRMGGVKDVSSTLSASTVWRTGCAARVMFEVLICASMLLQELSDVRSQQTGTTMPQSQSNSGEDELGELEKLQVKSVFVSSLCVSIS